MDDTLRRLYVDFTAVLETTVHGQSVLSLLLLPRDSETLDVSNILSVPGELSIRGKMDSGAYDIQKPGLDPLNTNQLDSEPLQGPLLLFHDLKLAFARLVSEYDQASKEYAEISDLFKFAVDLLLREAHRLSLVHLGAGTDRDDAYLARISLGFQTISAEIQEPNNETFYVTAANGPLFMSASNKAPVDPRDTAVAGSVHTVKLLPHIARAPESTLGFTSPLHPRFPQPNAPPTEILSTFVHPNSHQTVPPLWLASTDDFGSFAPSTDFGGAVVTSEDAAIVWDDRRKLHKARLAATLARPTAANSANPANLANPLNASPANPQSSNGQPGPTQSGNTNNQPGPNQPGNQSMNQPGNQPGSNQPSGPPTGAPAPAPAQLHGPSTNPQTSSLPSSLPSNLPSGQAGTLPGQFSQSKSPESARSSPSTANADHPIPSPFDPIPLPHLGNYNSTYQPGFPHPQKGGIPAQTPDAQTHVQQPHLPQQLPPHLQQQQQQQPQQQSQQQPRQQAQSVPPLTGTDLELLLRWSPYSFVDDDEIEAARTGTEHELVSRLLLELQYMQRERLSAPGVELEVGESERHVALKSANVLARLVGRAESKDIDLKLDTRLPVIMRNYAGSLPAATDPALCMSSQPMYQQPRLQSLQGMRQNSLRRPTRR